LRAEVPLYAPGMVLGAQDRGYRGTSLTRKRFLLGPYSRPTPRALWWFEGEGGFLMSKALLCMAPSTWPELPRS